MSDNPSHIGKAYEEGIGMIKLPSGAAGAAQIHRPGSSVPELSNPVKAAPELSSSQHLSTSLQRLYRYFATVVRYFATSR
jgi:hypothetical protein